MLIVAFGQKFDYSNHPIMFTVNRTVGTGAVSAETASGYMILVENDQTLCSLCCPPDLNLMDYLNVKLIHVTKMKQFLLNKIFLLETNC